MSDYKNRFYIYKGYKIYEPELLTSFNGTKYWNYAPPELSCKPMSGYSTKQNYYIAEKREIDERISFGHWTDNFGQLK